MSNDYDNTNSGVLFKNDKEGGNPNWPDYKGSLDVGGKQFWLSAWIKEGKKGKFMSLSIKPKDSPEQGASKAKAAAASIDRHDDPFPDDDIPF